MNLILKELLNNSHRSDHEIAKKIGISQPTVSRLRIQLEKEKIIQKYTIIPNLSSMGFSIMAIFTIRYGSNGVNINEILADISKHNSLFASRAQGLGKNIVIISVFKNYSEYAKYLNKISNKYGDILKNVDSILIDLKGPVIKPLSFTNVA